MMASAGFENLEVLTDEPQSSELLLQDPTMKRVLRENNIPVGVAKSVISTIRSVTIRGEKPQQAS